MKKTVVFTAMAMCIFGLGFGMAASRYEGGGDSSPGPYGILTPASEKGDLASGTGAWIPDEEVPLAPGPGGVAAEPGLVAEAGQPVIQESPYIRQVVSLVNEERTKAGLTTLEKSDNISLAAAVRAEELTSSFSHTRPDGSAYRTVLEQNGVSYRSCGENVAFGYRTPEAVMSAWMTSEGHKENILNEKYTNIGVGYFKDSSGQGYWAQIFTVGR
ncbi:MAG: hypothetical protein HFG59_06520 [Lachnospiraceae bacterium]|nr:hypothetical protein [Lachnospiraceae bacterium]